MLAEGGPSRAKLAEILELPTSRVSQWLAGERGVEAATAFDVGEALRSHFDLATSGPDALYAAGHFADLLRLLRSAGLARDATSRERAVALYARLPGRFLRGEVAALDAYSGKIPDYQEHENDFDGHEAGRVRHDAGLERGQQGRTNAIRDEVDDLLAEDTSQVCIAAAWRRAQRLIENAFTVTFPLVDDTRLQESVALAPDRAQLPLIAYDLQAMQPTPDKVIAAIIEVVIALARALERHNPTTTAPRLWRMLAEWAHALDTAAFTRFSSLLPPVYAHFAVNSYQSLRGGAT